MMSVPVAPGGWPILGHTPAMLRKRSEFTSSLCSHGDLVRIALGPMPAYFVASPALTQQVLVTSGGSFRKGAMFDKFRPYLGTGLLLSDGEFHRRQRRLIQPAFHHDRLARYAEIMTSAASELAGSWRPGEVRMIDEDMQALAVTIVGKALFSTEIGERAIAEARRSVFVIIKQGMVRALAPGFVGQLAGGRSFDAAVARMRAIVLEVIENWRAEGVDHGDLLSALLLAGMTDEEAFDEVLTLLTGGIETTAIALAWTLHEIARSPEIEQRVHAEVDEVLGGRPVTFADVPKLTYLHQVVLEVLRQYPVWILMRRATVDVELGDFRLPAGAEVVVSPHALHFDPANFVSPHRFDPDRWAPGCPEPAKGAFIPFGAGARKCIGYAFAQQEIVIAAATVAARWRLVPVPEQPIRVKFTSAAYPRRMAMTAVPR